MNVTVKKEKGQTWAEAIHKAKLDASASVGVGIKDQLVVGYKPHEPPSTPDTKSSTPTKSPPSVKSATPLANSTTSTKSTAVQSDSKRAVGSKVNDEEEDDEVVCLGTVTMDEARKKKLQRERTKRQFKVDERDYLKSCAKKVRIQHDKIMRAVKKQHRMIKELKERSDHTVQTKMTDFIKPSDGLKAKMLIKPGPWDHKGEIEGERSTSNMIYGSVCDNFDEWIEEEEGKRKPKGSKKVRKYLGVVDLEKYGNEKCKGCGQIMTECHDIKYGAWCLHEVIVYVMRAPSFACTNAAKKIFIDTYNQSYGFSSFHDITEKKTHVDWVFPPTCVQRNSYDYAMYWFVDYIENVYHGGIFNTTDEDDNDDSEGSIESTEDADSEDSGKKVGVKEEKVE